MSEKNTEELLKSYKDLVEKKESLFVEQQTISTQIKHTIDEIKKHRDVRDTFTKKVQEEKKKRNELNAEIKKLITEIKKVQGDTPQVPRDRSKKPLTYGRVKKQIQDLQTKMETEALPFDKEQQLMKLVKEKKKLLDQVQKTEGSDNSKIGRELSKLKKESDVIHKEIQDAAQKSQEEHEALLSLSKQVDTLREKEKGIRSEIDATKAELKKLRAVVKPPQTRKRVSVPRQPTRSDAEIEKRAEVVEEKLKGKKKLTTDDLLALQAMPVSKDKK
ncbi:MAG: hypothetical protein ACMXYA_02325 [Candidatus Woesearchaeota archaeon]